MLICQSEAEKGKAREGKKYDGAAAREQNRTNNISLPSSPPPFPFPFVLFLMSVAAKWIEEMGAVGDNSDGSAWRTTIQASNNCLLFL